jgi:hypothetical protein
MALTLARRSTSSLLLLGIIFTPSLGIVATAKAKPRDTSAALQVEIKYVRRLGPEAVEVSFKVTNGGDQAIFIPDVEVPGSLQLVTLQVFHFDDRRGWGLLGPFYDVPAGSATVMKPAQELSSAERLHDPCIVVLPGKPIPHYRIKPTPLGGRYKITIGYYDSEAEWNKYLEVLHSNRMPKKPPHLRYVESEEFSIPPR